MIVTFRFWFLERSRGYEWPKHSSGGSQEYHMASDVDCSPSRGQLSARLRLSTSL